MYRCYTYIYKKGNVIEINYYPQNYNYKLVLTNYLGTFLYYITEDIENLLQVIKERKDNFKLFNNQMSDANKNEIHHGKNCIRIRVDSIVIILFHP